MEPRDERSAPRSGSGTIGGGGGLHDYMLISRCGHVDLVVRLEDDIFVRAPFLDHAFQIHYEVFAVLARQLALFACWRNRRNRPRE